MAIQTTTTCFCQIVEHDLYVAVYTCTKHRNDNNLVRALRTAIEEMTRV